VIADELPFTIKTIFQTICISEQGNAPVFSFHKTLSLYATVAPHRNYTGKTLTPHFPALVGQDTVSLEGNYLLKSQTQR
jgi:hypothetical protein